MTMARSITLAGVFALCAMGSPSHAKQADRQAPIATFAKITHAYDGANAVTTLTGDVKVTQGSLLVTGDIAQLTLDADQQISRVVVTGHPAHIQQLDEQDRLVQGDALTLDYDNIRHIAVLTASAVVKVQGQGDVHGDRLTYDVDSTELIGQSIGDGMVHGSILPRRDMQTNSRSSNGR